MSAIADQLSAIQKLNSAPSLPENWSRLFGFAAKPHKPIEDLPAVPEDAYGLQLGHGYPPVRCGLLRKRRRLMLAYLRECGPLTTGAVAKAFGIAKQAAYQDLCHLLDVQQVRANFARPFKGRIVQWSASGVSQ